MNMYRKQTEDNWAPRSKRVCLPWTCTEIDFESMKYLKHALSKHEKQIKINQSNWIVPRFKRNFPIF